MRVDFHSHVRILTPAVILSFLLGLCRDLGGWRLSSHQRCTHKARGLCGCADAVSGRLVISSFLNCSPQCLPISIEGQAVIYSSGTRCVCACTFDAGAARHRLERDDFFLCWLLYWSLAVFLENWQEERWGDLTQICFFSALLTGSEIKWGQMLRKLFLTWGFVLFMDSIFFSWVSFIVAKYT